MKDFVETVDSSEEAQNQYGESWTISQDGKILLIWREKPVPKYLEDIINAWPKIVMYVTDFWPNDD